MSSVHQSLRLEEMAIRRGWNIRADDRNRIMESVTRIALDPDTSERNRIAAARVFLAANGQDIDIEKHVVNTALKVYEMGGNPLAAPAEATQATLENASDAELEKLANGNQH